MKMKVLVILAHPRRGSFNHAIAGAVVETLAGLGRKALYHDLYEEKFDPVLPADEIHKNAGVDRAIAKQCDELRECGGIVIVHPNWWGQPPAILKGWIDRVIRPGVAYEFADGDGGEGIPIGLLKGKIGLVFNTSNTPVEREQGVFGDPLENLWKTCIFGLCGITTFHRTMFGVMVTSNPEERNRWLREVRDTVRRYFG
jgi:NAD(P)H dehydrogenase (quinone)